MKTLRLFIFGMALILASTVKAQVGVTVNIGAPPMWGPAGYEGIRYYYLPDIESYYDVQSSLFIYRSGGVWIHRTYLPTRYRNYDLYGGYKVVMNDYHGNAPYSHFRDHKRSYARGYHGQPQHNIGERPGRGNQGGNFQPQHRSVKQPKHSNNRNEGRGDNNSKKGRGNGNDHGKGNGRK